MSAREVTMWVAACDCCGELAASPDEIEGFCGSSPERALLMALGSGAGWEEADKLFCPSCWRHHLNPPEPHP